MYFVKQSTGSCLHTSLPSQLKIATWNSANRLSKSRFVNLWKVSTLIAYKIMEYNKCMQLYIISLRALRGFVVNGIITQHATIMCKVILIIWKRWSDTVDKLCCYDFTISTFLTHSICIFVSWFCSTLIYTLKRYCICYYYYCFCYNFLLYSTRKT